MLIYIICLLSIPALSIILKLIPCRISTRHKILCAIVGFELFIIAAFRSTTVGIDLENYLPMFYTIAELPFKDIFSITWEPGYLIFNKLLSYISSDGRCLLIGTSLFIIVGYVTFIYKNLTSPWIGLFLFVALGLFTNSFNIIRQSMALVIVLHSLKYIHTQEYFKYFLSIFLAALFHVTAAICFVIPIINHLKVNLGNFTILLLCSIIIIPLIANSILSYAMQIIFSEYSLGDKSSGGFNMLIVLIVLTLISILFSFKSNANKLYCNMMALACCLQIVSLQFSLFARVVTYFSSILIILVPSIVERLNSTETRIITTIMTLVIGLTYFILVVLNNDLSGVVPYSFM